VLASLTSLPVIGVPLAGTPLAGIDSLLSIVQMPPGVPVATVAVGEMGARNAGHLAARILALSDPDVAAAVRARRQEMAGRVRLPEGFDVPGGGSEET
jgi:phosphoribosylaminoimidazole carboxylase PurE protein